MGDPIRGPSTSTALSTRGDAGPPGAPRLGITERVRPLAVRDDEHSDRRAGSGEVRQQAADPERLVIRVSDTTTTRRYRRTRAEHVEGRDVVPAGRSEPGALSGAGSAWWNGTGAALMAASVVGLGPGGDQAPQRGQVALGVVLAM